jgi:hypothetical protein
MEIPDIVCTLSFFFYIKSPSRYSHAMSGFILGCWITERYPVQRIVEEYLFLWLSAFVSIICYIPLAFVVSGRVVVDGLKVRFPDRENRVHALQSASNRSTRESTKLALQMVFYPIVYIITVSLAYDCGVAVLLVMWLMHVCAYSIGASNCYRSFYPVFRCSRCVSRGFPKLRP